MARRATKENEDAGGCLSRISDLDRVFRGVPMGLRPTETRQEPERNTLETRGLLQPRSPAPGPVPSGIARRS
jgi:hypothetical protein